MNKNLIVITIIAAITILIIYSINFHTIQLPSEQLKNDYWEQEAKYNNENASFICPPSKAGQPISPNSCKRQDHYSYDRQQQIADHKAQVSMRNAAWAGMIIGLGGLILLWLTLSETRKAAIAANKTLNEAKTATDLSRKTSIAEFKPYLSVSDIIIPDSPQFPDQDEIVSYGDIDVNVDEFGVPTNWKFPVVNQFVIIPINFTLNNWGKTPAQHLMFEIYMSVKKNGKKLISGKQANIPAMRHKTYLSPRDGDVPFKFKISAKSEIQIKPNLSHIDLTYGHINIVLHVMYIDFNGEKRGYQFTFEGIFNGTPIKNKSVEEIKQT